MKKYFISYVYNNGRFGRLILRTKEKISIESIEEVERQIDDEREHKGTIVLFFKEIS